jgi:hypothetical protein
MMRVSEDDIPIIRRSVSRRHPDAGISLSLSSRLIILKLERVLNGVEQSGHCSVNEANNDSVSSDDVDENEDPVVLENLDTTQIKPSSSGSLLSWCLPAIGNPANTL